MNQQICSIIWFINDSYNHLWSPSLLGLKLCSSFSAPRPETGVCNTLSCTLFTSLEPLAAPTGLSAVCRDPQIPYLSLRSVLLLSWRLRYWLHERNCLKLGDFDKNYIFIHFGGSKVPFIKNLWKKNWKLKGHSFWGCSV